MNYDLAAGHRHIKGKSIPYNHGIARSLWMGHLDHGHLLLHVAREAYWTFGLRQHGPVSMSRARQSHQSKRTLSSDRGVAELFVLLSTGQDSQERDAGFL